MNAARQPQPPPDPRPLLDYFGRILPLSETEREAIAASIVTRSYPKGTLLLREGQVSTECYFILRGCVREYCLTEGEEKTTAFYTEEQWVLSLASFSHRIPAAHSWVCVEDTTLVVGNEQRENDLYRQSARLETVARKVLEQVVAEQQRAAMAYLTETPEQRYRNLLRTRPDLLQRVPQYQLASYVGVKPESLSRIRKRLAHRDAVH